MKFSLSSCSMRWRSVILSIWLLSRAWPAGVVAPPAVALLKARCATCHNAKTAQGKLDLSTRESALHGGERGPALVPGNSRDSLLYQLASHQVQPFMPLAGNALSADELKTLAAWIDSGASWPANSVPSSPASGLFESVVKPMFAQRCASCHGAGGRKTAGLDVSSREALLRGGDDGPAINLANPESSPLVARLRHTAKPGMPYNQAALPAAVVDKVVEWIRSGAPYDAPIDLARIPIGFAKPVPWSFVKPVAPAVPKVRPPLESWSRNPVDRFLAAKWQEKGLQPSPEADRRTLIRRVYLDLTGLPPMPAAVTAFLNDRSPDAYEKLVDTVLASPQYGERWGRHWMDIWRYSDWYGNRLINNQRNSARHIWRWRDWIVESLNADKGYDEMIREMIAGDEMAPANPKILAATGFLARDYYRYNRNTWLQDTVDQVGTGLLGVTFKCARCHDHKYDPISQEEYYRFRAFFERYDVRIDPVPGAADFHDDGLARVYDALPREGDRKDTYIPIPPIYENTYRFIRGDENSPDKTPLAPGTPLVFGKLGVEIKPVKLDITARIPGMRDFVPRDLVAGARQELRDAETAVHTASGTLERATAALAARNGKAFQPDHAEKPAVNFEKISPILFHKCQRCHGGISDAPVRGGLLLTTEAAALKGGNRYGPAVIRGRSAESPLIQFCRGELTPKMPMEGEPPTAAELAQLSAWIDGIPQPDPAVTVREATDNLALARKHLETVQLSIPALEARLAADRARYLHRDDKQRNGELEKAATEAERRYARAQAAEEMLGAQQLLATDKNSAAKGKLEAAAKALAQGAETYSPALDVFPDTSTGRRTALAHWLGSRENPLTARVSINHIWMRHFGTPLVASVGNFGNNGTNPTDQPLLDWLAVQFMDHGWSMKAIHRLLVTSSAYRMISSGPGLSAANRQVDPENIWYWRMNSRRMEAEVVRDTALQLAGKLDLTLGGPDIDDAQALSSGRRSLYLRQSPENHVDFLSVFDAPSPDQCERRSENILPQQALATANSSLYEEAAHLLADSLAKQHPDVDSFISSCFEAVLGRPSTPEEMSVSKQFVAKQAELLTNPAQLSLISSPITGSDAASEPQRRAREDLVHAVLNYNEFITVR
jgi:hypothetical protein